jgi:hypothetical protein
MTCSWLDLDRLYPRDNVALDRLDHLVTAWLRGLDVYLTVHCYHEEKRGFCSVHKCDANAITHIYLNKAINIPLYVAT